MATPNVPAQAQAPRMTPQQQNDLATRAILANAVDRIQQVASVTINPANNPTIIVQPINVGLIKRFTIVVEGIITNTSPTDPMNVNLWGLCNIFGPGGVTYTDLNNYLRVNTSGQHLSYLASVKRRKPFAGLYETGVQTVGAVTSMGSMVGTPASTWPVISLETPIPAASSGAFRAVFEVPLAYSDDDLRGAVYANVLNAVQQLTLTINPQIQAANGVDAQFAVLLPNGVGAAAGLATVTSATITVYQHYLDQLPTVMSNGVPTTVLPALSLSTVYELKSTQFQNVPQNQEFYIPYANQRSFISTYASFNPDGNLNYNTGSDVNYWALLAANSSYIWKLDPLTVASISRNETGIEFPPGTYYFSTRRRNIATLQYGNLALTLNARNSTSASSVNVGWEAFALQNTLQTGASLASGG
jgi:P3 major capsid protein